MTCSEGGSEALEPRPWDQGERAQASWSPRSFRSRVPQSSRLQSTVDERMQRARRRSNAAQRHGLPARKGLSSENPMSGSGPSVSARPEGDQAVEGVRNPEDGRGRTGRSDPTIPPPTSLKGRETLGGATRSGMTGEGALARTLRGRRSLRERPVGLRTERTVGRRNASWSYKRRGGGGEPMSPLRRTKSSERPVNPERVV